ncbi:putative reverse transcriptase domain-containing protein [Tanacetum coccineum]
MDFVTKLPRTSDGHDTIWVIVDRLTKSPHFIPTREKVSMETLTRLYIKEIVSQHGMPISVILDRDSHFTSRFWKSLQNALVTMPALRLRASVIDFEKGWGKHLPLITYLLGRSGDVQLTGPKIIHETTEKIVQIRQRLQAARDWQKSYANVRRKPLEFQVGYRVMLKVSPRKGIIRFGKRGKLNPQYIGPFKILERIGPVAYKLELLEELSNVHNTFHVPNLKKYLSDESLVIPMKELRLDDKLNFVEETVEIMDREVKQLKQSRNWRSYGMKGTIEMVKLNYCLFKQRDRDCHLLYFIHTQAFEIRESSRKISMERHKEQIKEILNHLDELSLDRIEHIEDKIEGLGKGRVIIQQDFDNLEAELQEMPPKRTSTSKAPAMTQAAIRKLVADSVTAALEAQAATMANADNTNRNIGEREAHVARKCSYKEFMSCQPINFKGSEGAVGLIRWFERTESVFSRSNCTEDCKVKFATGTLTEEALSWWNSFAQPIRIEEAYKITWVEFKKLLIKKHMLEDSELANLCPTMVPDSEKMMEVFIGGLPQSIEGNVTASKPQTLEEAINIAQRLMDQVTKHNPVQVSSDHKRKTEDKKPSGLILSLLLENTGILEIFLINKGPATRSNLLPVTVTCHACGEKGHYANQCRKTTNNNAQGRAYMLRDRNAHQDPNVVTGMFLLNQHLARVLFDSGADKSFVSISLASMLNIPPITIDTFTMRNMADGNLASTNTVIQGATLTLLNQPFKIDLMLIKLGSFDVVIGMDWLSKYHARIICDEKVIHIPINGETLIIRVVGKRFNIARVKAECQKPSGLLVQPKIPMWKWERITMDFITKLPKTSNEHDTIWVIVDLLTKSTHFIPTRETDSMETLTRLYIKEIVSWHGVPISIISNRDSHFTSRFWQSLQSTLGTQLDMSTAYHPETDGRSERTIQTLEDMLQACVIDFGKGWERHLPLVEFSYNNNYHASIKAAPFEALYGRKCRSPVCWAEVGDVQLTGPEIIHETTEKIVQIRQRLQAARAAKEVSQLAYKLELPEELSNIHSTFHVSNLKKCLSDESLVIPMKELRLDDKLNFVEEPVEIMDREVKQLKQSRIPIVKVRWNSKRGPEFTWEREDQIRAKYPHLFSNITPASN